MSLSQSQLNDLVYNVLQQQFATTMTMTRVRALSSWNNKKNNKPPFLFRGTTAATVEDEHQIPIRHGDVITILASQPWIRKVITQRTLLSKKMQPRVSFSLSDAKTTTTTTITNDNDRPTNTKEEAHSVQQQEQDQEKCHAHSGSSSSKRTLRVRFAPGTKTGDGNHQQHVRRLEMNGPNRDVDYVTSGFAGTRSRVGSGTRLNGSLLLSNLAWPPLDEIRSSAMDSISSSSSSGSIFNYYSQTHQQYTQMTSREGAVSSTSSLATNTRTEPSSTQVGATKDKTRATVWNDFNDDTDKEEKVEETQVTSSSVDETKGKSSTSIIPVTATAGASRNDNAEEKEEDDDRKEEEDSGIRNISTTGSPGVGWNANGCVSPYTWLDSNSSTRATAVCPGGNCLLKSKRFCSSSLTLNTLNSHHRNNRHSWFLTKRLGPIKSSRRLLLYLDMREYSSLG